MVAMQFDELLHTSQVSVTILLLLPWQSNFKDKRLYFGSKYSLSW